MDFLKLDQLKTVIQAMWYPKVELMLAPLLLAIVEYYFAILGYLVFYGDYEQLWLERIPRQCDMFWHCLMMTFDWTFKFTGSIGAHIMDSLTVKDELMPQFPGGTPDEFSAFIGDSYNGTSHKFTANYY
jgi:inositol 1,4,5-triphosphate receptor type 3